MTQFYSRNDVKYNGDVYSIPFPYMKEEEIHVYLDDVLVTDWFFLNDSQIRLRSLPEEVTSDTVVSVRRVTNIDDKVVTYTNNTLLNKENLNLSQDQLLHAVQEIYDNNEVFKQGTNEILIDNKQEILNLQSEFEDEVNTKIEMVSSAAEKINQLEDAVDTAVTAANTASQKADDIEQFVTKTEQSFNTNIQDAISESQALLQEAGEALNETKQKVEEVGGMLSLEIGDIGIAPLGIDETKGKRRYLNGQLIIQDQYIQFTNKVKSAVALYPSLACTESEWQTTATMTVGGQVGKFVVDDNAGTIRLPKIIMPIQGLTDLSKLGEIVEAGLPNIEGNLGQLPTGAGYDENTNGSFYFVRHTTTTNNTWGSSNGNRTVYGFDASRSSLIYGNSDTVQQEQIQYPYFIQVATGAETEDNIINEIELNNPFSLLDYKYSEYELNNLSWLRSNGQYNSKAVYPAVYDLLLKIYNGTEIKAGVSVKLSTEAFTDYDFVLNTSDETFRLPIKVKLASGKAVVGNGMCIGYTNGTINFGSQTNAKTDYPYPILTIGNYGSVVGTATEGVGTRPTTTEGIGITTDPTKSGIETSDSGLYLYFYVGETVQNANLINAGRIEETLVTKTDKLQAAIASMPSSKYIDLTLGASGTEYTAPANGWFLFSKKNASSGQVLHVNVNGVNRYHQTQQGTGQAHVFFEPVNKGDVLSIGYALSGETNYFRFYYCNGEV